MSGKKEQEVNPVTYTNGLVAKWKRSVGQNSD